MAPKTTAGNGGLAAGRAQLAKWFAQAEASTGGTAGVIVVPAGASGGKARIDIQDAEVVGGVFIVRRRVATKGK
jgi:hypothetical protein